MLRIGSSDLPALDSGFTDLVQVKPGSFRSDTADGSSTRKMSIDEAAFDAFRRLFTQEITPDHEFRWHPSRHHDTRRQVSASDMGTMHLYRTIRMIWNHTLPWKFEPYRQYTFSPIWTAEYVRRSITALGRELLTRTNCPAEVNDSLATMRNHIFENNRGLASENG